MATRDSDHWKEKYMASLDDLESKENAWEQVEKTLRQSLSRLSLAVETSDQRLGTQLESLRKALRSKASVEQIGVLMEDISKSLLRLDQQREGPGGVETMLLRYQRGLERLQVPDALKQETRELGKQLRDAAKAEDMRLALDAYANYLTKVVGWLGAPQTSEKEGLLGRLFGRKNGESPDDARTDPAVVLGSADEETGPTLEVGLPAFNQVLFDLIHRLALPEELTAQCQEIAALLAEPPSIESANRAVAEIADLMAMARHHDEREKKDIESFLSQLTGRLEEIDRYLEDTVGYSEQAARQGDAIDESMVAEVDGIRRSVNEAEDIDQLKGSIQAHLMSIQSHMDARRRLEQDRASKADAEIRHLKLELNNVQGESRELRERLTEAHERALHDALTGLGNRFAYEERMKQECERWRRYARPTVLSIWDVDHFKRINDRYGHNAGDNVLKILGRLLKKHTRKSDFIARFGGEEFMMLLPETDIEVAYAVAEKLRQLIAASKFMYHGQPVPVTISCGLAEFVADDEPDKVFQRADVALYEAKQVGRNCCRIYGQNVGAGTELPGGGRIR